MWEKLYETAVDCVLDTFPSSPVEQPIWTEAEEICSYPEVIGHFHRYLLKALAVDKWRSCVVIAQAQGDAGRLGKKKGVQALAEVLTQSVKLMKVDPKVAPVVDPKVDLDSPGGSSLSLSLFCMILFSSLFVFDI